MTLDNIPADTLMTLTAELDRLFKFAHCKPSCHACRKPIEVGSAFQLLSFKGKDEMLCTNCDKEKLIEAKAEAARLHEEYLKSPEYAHRNQSLKNGRWGYSRPSQSLEVK